MIDYVYLGTVRNPERRERRMDDVEAWETLGERVMNGWPVVQRFVRTPSGENVFVAAVTNDAGHVWGVYSD